MKMSYDQLKKQATKTSLYAGHGTGKCFHEGNIDCICTLDNPDNPESEVTVAEVWPTVPKSEAKATCILLAHCYNAFDLALEIVQKAFEKACKENNDQEWIDQLDETIIQLKNV